MSASQAGRRRFESGRPLLTEDADHFVGVFFLPLTSTRRMPEFRTEKFILTGYGGSTTAGEATVMHFDGAERIARAGKELAIAWGAALVGVFIPVAHFLLVPGFFLAGLIVFAKTVRRRVVVDTICGRCPDCRHEQNFDTSTAWHLPMHLTCANCQRLLTATSPPN